MADLTHTPTGRVADADAANRSYVGRAKQIYDLIAADDVGPRARLPSERTLAERFGVSRTQVREAIIALEVQGVVEVRVGLGIQVAKAPEARSVTFELPRGLDPIQTLRARAVIESGIAALAAAERKDSDLDQIFAALRAMRENMGDKAANEAADGCIPRRIAPCIRACTLAVALLSRRAGTARRVSSSKSRRN
jgi:DNA-binding FadR family transcriptional regulator